MASGLLLEEEVDIIRAWAASTPEVRRCWVFGSRARGEARPDSDLDIAVELMVAANPRPHPHEPEGTMNDDEYDRIVMWETEGWAAQLAARLPYRVDLQLNEGEHLSPVVTAGVARDGLLVFARPAQEVEA